MFALEVDVEVGDHHLLDEGLPGSAEKQIEQVAG